MAQTEPREKARRAHLAWQQAVLQYPCPSCHVAPGEWCITASGRPFHEPHADRARLAAADHWNTHLDDGPDGPD